MKRLLPLSALFLLFGLYVSAQYGEDFAINQTGFVDPNSGKLVTDPNEMSRTIERTLDEARRQSQSSSSSSSSSAPTSSSAPVSKPERGSSSTGMAIDNTGYTAPEPAPSSAPSEVEEYNAPVEAAPTPEVIIPDENQENASDMQDGTSTLLLVWGTVFLVGLFAVILLLIYLLFKRKGDK